MRYRENFSYHLPGIMKERSEYKMSCVKHTTWVYKMMTFTKLTKYQYEMCAWLTAAVIPPVTAPQILTASLKTIKNMCSTR